MSVLILFFVYVFVPCVFGQEAAACYGAGSVAGAAIGAFIAALILVAAAYYLRKLYWKSRKGKHLVFSTDPESVKDEFAFDNPGFKQDERWQHDATLPVGGKPSVLHAEFTKPEQSKDDTFLQRARIRRVKLWARDFTGLGFRCGGGARDGVHVHSVLRSGPAAAAKLQPGDKIKSIKIQLMGTPLEDAVSILSLASPYPVELEVVEGGRASGDGRTVHHPLLKRAGSTGDVTTLEKEGKLLHPPKSPNTSNSNNSTLETKYGKSGIKKISEKIITSTLERNKKEKRDGLPTTLERENEKNSKMAKSRHSDVPSGLSKPERNKTRHSTGADVIMPPENGTSQIEHAEMQKRDYDPKRGMKFGIRVLPPNVPDDGVLRQKSVENGSATVEKRSVDEIDKPEPPRPAPTVQIKHENETEHKKPVVAKRREKMAPPIPNARVKTNETESISHETTVSDASQASFARNDLNSSGIKRDENGIPQEIPQQMLDAAKAARTNRKSSVEILNEKERQDNRKERKSSAETSHDKEKHEQQRDEAPKPAKKSKGKAPSPPDADKNKTDDSILERLQRVKDFLKSEKYHSSLLNDSSADTSGRASATRINTSTPKVNKTKSTSSTRLEDSINFSQDDIDDIVSKPFKRESDSLNNFFEDSKSNLSSNQDVHSVISLNQSDKSERGSTTIELNNSDITIHSSPLNATVQSGSGDTSLLDENERKAASLGDLSRFDLRTNAGKPSTGTLERAQSLDITADDTEIAEATISPKKRKAMSVVETNFYEASGEDTLPDTLDSDNGIVIKHKEPRLSLNVKTSAMEGLSTFQRNRLKKASEFGNLEDAIVKGSSSSIESDKVDEDHDKRTKSGLRIGSEHETSDHLAKRIMDENMKVHLKLVSEFAKTTSDGSTLAPPDNDPSTQPNLTKLETTPTKYDEKITMNYDTNIPDDLKVSRSSYANSLERPKSEMMKKLLAKNPILNVHIDQSTQREASTSAEVQTPMTDASKSAMHQPDIVNFDLKPSEMKTKDYEDFVSNIRVGSNNSSLNKKMESFSTDWRDSKEGSDLVTFTTDRTQNLEDKTRKTYTKSIEIGEPTMRVMPPDVLEGIRRRHDEKENRTLYMEPGNVSLTMTQEPTQKTVTVNVAEDEFGNKVITRNVEQISTKYVTAKTEAPLQVEQFSFGIMRNAGPTDELALVDGNVKNIDKNVLDEIRRQNPNMHFASDEPSYTKTETIILSTSDMDEGQARALMEKMKNDPSFVTRKTPEEPSRLGVRITQDLEDVQTFTEDATELTKTRYSIRPASASDEQCKLESHDDAHVTEIEVVATRADRNVKEKPDKIHSRQRVPYREPVLSYELDIELLSNFISNERYHSARQMAEVKKTKTTASDPKKRHSDYDLPRNSHIKFRTATYESPKGTIVTSTDLENRRLSELDQMQLRSVSPPQKPVLLAKPSSIPVKATEKTAKTGVSSKIPIVSALKSSSQENLAESRFSLPRSPPPQYGSSGNISVTSIKSSSRSPSGGKF
ncbi:uncharacterized protein LOC114246722 [Bombyx mandarina]|uniref:Uncharacterized protein LOC114246722 n=1 Tax=Bombyx mandarina TaxID=7092 RepID=A0A6J2K2H3_BOMMA|nr:uncharacterized protein LOC114246722 [Bombyx mandarina]